MMGRCMRVESVGNLRVHRHNVSHGWRAAGRVVIDPSRLAASAQSGSRAWTHSRTQDSTGLIPSVGGEP